MNLRSNYGKLGSENEKINYAIVYIDNITYKEYI